MYCQITATPSSLNSTPKTLERHVGRVMRLIEQWCTSVSKPIRDNTQFRTRGPRSSHLLCTGPVVPEPLDVLGDYVEDDMYLSAAPPSDDIPEEYLSPSRKPD